MSYSQISRTQLITEVANRCDFYPEDVQLMYDALTAIIIDHLVDADEEHNVSVNLCPGIMLRTDYIPEEDHRMPSGEIIKLPPRLKFSGHFAREWRRERNKEYQASARCLERWKKNKEKTEKKKK